MHITQFTSTAAVLISKESIKYLLSVVVAIAGDFFFFFYRKVHNSILLGLDHGMCFVSLVSTQSSLVRMISLESIFQTFLCLEVL